MVKHLKGRGIQASCGCKRAETIKTKNTKHGMSAHPAYAVWRSMLDRCRLPTHQAWANYGGRGIFVFEPWRKDRRAFLRYLAGLEGWDRPMLELDRMDVDRGYEPGNLRFVTRRENQGNRRTVQEMQQRISDLEAHIRHLERGSTE